MTTRLTFPASMFSVVCQRCGSTMRKNADSCPNCGADRNAASAQSRSAGSTPERPRSSMFEQKMSQPLASMSTTGAASMPDGAAAAAAVPGEPAAERGWPSGWDPKRASERIAQRAAEHRAKRLEESARNAYAGPDPDALPGSDAWSRRKSVVAGACAIALSFGAAFYLLHGEAGDDDVSPSADHSVSGTIDSRYAAPAPAIPSSAGTRPSTSADTRAPVSGDALRDVRLALDQRDLTLARARLKTVPAPQQTRADFEAMKDELVRRELQRDSALQLARACERTSAWACVQQNAAEALAIDGGNAESQALLERVISHAGWLVATPSGAKKPLPPVAAGGEVTKSANVAPAPSGAVAANAGKPPVSAPAMANVEVATPPVKTVNLAPKTAAERRAAQRTTAAGARRDAIDEARADASTDSRAEKIARAQAATNAITAATVAPAAAAAAPLTSPATSTPGAATATARTAMQTSPSAATTTAAIAPSTVASPTPAPAPAAPAALVSTTVTANAAATAAGPATAIANLPAAAARPATPGAPAPAASTNPAAPATRSAAPSGTARGAASTGMYDAAMNRNSASDDMYVAPQARGANASNASSNNNAGAANGMYDATSNRGATSNGMYVAPAAQNAAPRAAAASNTTVAAAHGTAQQTSPAPQAQLAAAPAGVAPAAASRAGASFGASGLPAHMDADKTEELERAIKQYGWSSGSTTPKPAP